MTMPRCFNKTRRLALLLPVTMPVLVGCNETQSPGDVLIETFGNFVKGLIDAGIAFMLGF